MGPSTTCVFYGNGSLRHGSVGNTQIQLGCCFFLCRDPTGIPFSRVLSLRHPRNTWRLGCGRLYRGCGPNAKYGSGSLSNVETATTMKITTRKDTRTIPTRSSSSKIMMMMMMMMIFISSWISQPLCIYLPVVRWAPAGIFSETIYLDLMVRKRHHFASYVSSWKLVFLNSKLC